MNRNIRLTCLDCGEVSNVTITRTPKTDEILRIRCIHCERVLEVPWNSGFFKPAPPPPLVKPAWFDSMMGNPKNAA